MQLQQKGRAKCMCPNGVRYETDVFENCTPACVGGAIYLEAVPAAPCFLFN